MSKLILTLPDSSQQKLVFNTTLNPHDASFLDTIISLLQQKANFIELYLPALSLALSHQTDVLPYIFHEYNTLFNLLGDDAKFKLLVAYMLMAYDQTMRIESDSIISSIIDIIKDFKSFSLSSELSLSQFFNITNSSNDFYTNNIFLETRTWLVTKIDVVMKKLTQNITLNIVQTIAARIIKNLLLTLIKEYAKDSKLTAELFDKLANITNETSLQDFMTHFKTYLAVFYNTAIHAQLVIHTPTASKSYAAPHSEVTHTPQSHLKNQLMLYLIRELFTPDESVASTYESRTATLWAFATTIVRHDYTLSGTDIHTSISHSNSTSSSSSLPDDFNALAPAPTITDEKITMSIVSKLESQFPELDVPTATNMIIDFFTKATAVSSSPLTSHPIHLLAPLLVLVQLNELALTALVTHLTSDLDTSKRESLLTCLAKLDFNVRLLKKMFDATDNPLNRIAADILHAFIYAVNRQLGDEVGPFIGTLQWAGSLFNMTPTFNCDRAHKVAAALDLCQAAVHSMLDKPATLKKASMPALKDSDLGEIYAEWRAHLAIRLEYLARQKASSTSFGGKQHSALYTESSSNASSSSSSSPSSAFLPA